MISGAGKALDAMVREEWRHLAKPCLGGEKEPSVLAAGSRGERATSSLAIGDSEEQEA